MPNASDKLNSWQQHKSAKDVAKYMREEGRNVGRKYETHSDVWNAADSTVQTGLLHLILDKLEQIHGNEDELEKHREWLISWHPYLTKKLKEHDGLREKIIQMFGDDKSLGPDIKRININFFSELYRKNRQRHFEELRLLEKQIDRMRSVRKPEDVSNLKGIGKKTALRILDKMRNKDV